MKLYTSYKIISFGISAFQARGELKIHSWFNNAINLIDKVGNLISLVSKKIGNGPNNIVIDDFSNIDIANIKITKEHIILNDEKILKDKLLIYNDELPKVNIDMSLFKNNLKTLKELLKCKAHPMSCAFLIDKRRKSNFKTDFNRAMMNGIELGMNDLIKSEFTNGKKLSGLGMGLTPSGDDIINGSLLALSIYENITNNDTIAKRKKLYGSSVSKNIVSRTFLYYSYLGRYYEKFKDLFYGLSSKGNLESLAYNYMNIGETSGADILTGFIITMEKLLDMED